MLIDFLGVCLACCQLETCFYHVCCKDQKPKPPTKPPDEYSSMLQPESESVQAVRSNYCLAGRSVDAPPHQLFPIIAVT